MDMGFVVMCLLARHRRPPIRFLFIGSHLCSALLSGPASRRVLFHPCASLSLHLHLVVKRTAPPSCRTCSAHKQKARRGLPLQAFCGFLAGRFYLPNVITPNV